MGSVGAPELLIVLVIALVVFGGAKLPDLARSLGQAQREFKKGLSDDDEVLVQKRTSAGDGQPDPPTGGQGD